MYARTVELLKVTVRNDLQVRARERMDDGRPAWLLADDRFQAGLDGRVRAGDASGASWAYEGRLAAFDGLLMRYVE